MTTKNEKESVIGTNELCRIQAARVESLAKQNEPTQNARTIGGEHGKRGEPSVLRPDFEAVVVFCSYPARHMMDDSSTIVVRGHGT